MVNAGYHAWSAADRTGSLSNCAGGRCPAIAQRRPEPSLGSDRVEDGGAGSSVVAAGRPPRRGRERGRTCFVITVHEPAADGCRRAGHHPVRRGRQPPVPQPGHARPAAAGGAGRDPRRRHGDSSARALRPRAPGPLGRPRPLPGRGRAPGGDGPRRGRAPAAGGGAGERAKGSGSGRRARRRPPVRPFRARPAGRVQGGKVVGGGAEPEPARASATPRPPDRARRAHRSDPAHGSARSPRAARPPAVAPSPAPAPPGTRPGRPRGDGRAARRGPVAADRGRPGRAQPLRGGQPRPPGRNPGCTRDRLPKLRQPAPAARVERGAGGAGPAPAGGRHPAPGRRNRLRARPGPLSHPGLAPPDRQRLPEARPARLVLSGRDRVDGGHGTGPAAPRGDARRPPRRPPPGGGGPAAAGGGVPGRITPGLARSRHLGPSR